MSPEGRQYCPPKGNVEPQEYYQDITDDHWNDSEMGSSVPAYLVVCAYNTTMAMMSLQPSSTKHSYDINHCRSRKIKTRSMEGTYFLQNPNKNKNKKYNNIKNNEIGKQGHAIIHPQTHKPCTYIPYMPNHVSPSACGSQPHKKKGF